MVLPRTVPSQEIFGLAPPDRTATWASEAVDKKQRSRGILARGRDHLCREQCHFAWGMESEESGACFSGLDVKELLLTGESIVRRGESEMKPGEDIH